MNAAVVYLLIFFAILIFTAVMVIGTGKSEWGYSLLAIIPLGVTVIVDQSTPKDRDKKDKAE
jgi:hypothetical protein